MKYETSKSSYGTFFGNLFGKTNKEYRIFIDKAISELNAVSEKDKKRKEELTQKDKKRKEEFIIRFISFFEIAGLLIIKFLSNSYNILFN